MSISDIMRMILFVCLPLVVKADFIISGVITDESLKPLTNVWIHILPDGISSTTDENGYFEFNHLMPGEYEVIFSLDNYQTVTKKLNLQQSIELNIHLKKLEVQLSEVVITSEAEERFRIRRLRAVEGTSIFAGKKTEVVLLDKLTANVAANNPRQIYAQIAGLNIFESNDAGLQLNIGGRGLDPNRTANFNTRQNGYDMSADVLGYPESYYSPPAEALSEIQVIRGAASLQYGTQFGGLVNFKFKKPNADKKIEIISRQSIGSNKLFTSFNSLSGTIDRLSYYTFFNYKQGNDFRPNSKFDSKNLFAQLNYKIAENTTLNLDLTYMGYLAQQPGGLTDAQFEENPYFSNRARNWFQVDWKLWAVQLNHKFSTDADFSIQIFGLDADRNAVGFRTNRVSQTDDLTAPRDLLRGTFSNWGGEVRYLKRYMPADRIAVLLVGAKYYRSYNTVVQAAGSNGTDADFSIQNDQFPAYPNQSEFVFPNLNFSLFGEHIFYVNDNMSITPGMRVEYIRTKSMGDFRSIDFDLALNPIRDTLFSENRTFKRSRLLFGLGLSYKPSDIVEGYANFSQNYRSVTFNDIRVNNPTYQIDSDITDENGFNTDLGCRGRLDNVSFDANIFALLYDDRLGEVLRPQTRINADGVEVETGRIIRFRGNIGQAFIYGAEALVEWSILSPDIATHQPYKLNVYGNIAMTRSRYIQSEIAGVKGNEVEFVPRFNMKSGIEFGYKKLLGSFQYTLISSQYTDASNAPQNKSDNQSGIIGSIPTYDIADLSLSYRIKSVKIESGINNVLNSEYFTRRATGYPGPGIIPSAPRTYYLTLEIKI